MNSLDLYYCYRLCSPELGKTIINKYKLTKIFNKLILETKKLDIEKKLFDKEVLSLLDSFTAFILTNSFLFLVIKVEVFN